MKIAFTICSNNYLSQAKILGDSLIAHNPDYKFVIGLCDKKNPLVDYSPFDKFEIIEVDKIVVNNFDWMVHNYNIIELNTAIKPSFFLHFAATYPNADKIIYFDPDIKIYSKLTSIEDDLINNCTVLTPHILTPLDIDEKFPSENTFLNYGIYNLGFIAIRPCNNSIKLLKWWENKLKTKCWDRVCDGFFVDQLPMAYAPIFFEEVLVSKNMGYNVAYWNFHERELSLKDGKYYINRSTPLTFFHFSSFKPQLPLEISRYQNRFELREEEPVLYNLFLNYFNELNGNNYLELTNIPCYYTELRNNSIEQQKRKNKTHFRHKVKNILQIPVRLIKKN